MSMWMMGYSNPTSTTQAAENNGGVGASHHHHHELFSTNMNLTISPESFNNSRKLRPLVPARPSTIIPPLPSCFNYNATGDTSAFSALNHHLATSHHMVRDQQGKREFISSAQCVALSSRWNPTPEQLSALEGLYKHGTRTPSAEQIQDITAQLRKYGKIEGKNVFYWFQNHKARERQKRRRQLDYSPNDQHQQPQDDDQNQQTKEAGHQDHANNKNNNGTTGFEMEQTKLWPSSTNCSTLADQEPVPKTEKTAAAECVTDDEWVQFQDHHNSLQIASKAAAATTTTIWQDNDDDDEEHRRRRTSLNLMEKNAMSNVNNTNLFLHSPPVATSFSKASFMMHHISLLNDGVVDEDQDDDDRCNKEGALTLELFPLRSNGKYDGDEKGTKLTAPYQYFEFLPLKNSV